MPSALVTGVSRRIGIGWAVTHRLLADGWSVSASGWPAHDAEQPWGGDARTPDDSGLSWTAADLADPVLPARLVEQHVRAHGSLDALVAVHARSSTQNLVSLTAAELDTSFAVNTRATLLLAQAAARAGVRRVVLFTTGVHLEPMPDEIPYATSKAALQGMTATLAAVLAGGGATVNCVNPGPNDTGYADDDLRARSPARCRWSAAGDGPATPPTSWLGWYRTRRDG